MLEMLENNITKVIFFKEKLEEYRKFSIYAPLTIEAWENIVDPHPFTRQPLLFLTENNRSIVRRNGDPAF